MGAIVDTLVLGPRELSIIKGEYPHCVSRNLTNSDHAVQEYTIIIADEDETTYYDFLVANLIAASSNKFHWRFKSDKRFAERMRPRLRNAHIS